MTSEPTPSGRYADSVPMAPKSDPREVVRSLVACLAAVVVTLAVIAVIDRAWLDCAGELEPGERFAVRLPLLGVVVPLTLAALSIVALVTTIAFQRKRSVVWAVALGLSLTLTSVLAIGVAVPSPFDSGARDCAADDAPALVG
jgi:hypothetical protein